MSQEASNTPPPVPATDSTTEGKKSKKEMNKERKKEAKGNAKAAAKKAPPAPVPEAVWVHPTCGAPIARGVAALAGLKTPLVFVNSTIPLPGAEKIKAAPHQPYMTLKGNEIDRVHTDSGIAHALARFGGLGGTTDAVEIGQVHAWTSLASDAVRAGADAMRELLVSVESCLAMKTFLVGTGANPSIADVVLMEALCGLPEVVPQGKAKKDKKDKKKDKGTDDSSPAAAAAAAAAATGGKITVPDVKFPHVSRWAATLADRMAANGGLPNVQPPAAIAAAAAAATTEGKKGGAEANGGEKKAKVKGDVLQTMPPPLVDAVEGKVVTRFPPEPSGYLHLGHCKAVMLNDYYAKRYKGKLLVRFDDTNPSKEKQEYADNILKDLETLGVKPWKVTHSSDSFSICEEYARKLIAAGKAYMDDTDGDTMAAERMAQQPSKHRDVSVEKNLDIFEKLLKGDKEVLKFCMRAKIDMTSVNGTLRDPVMYRYNALPHIRTGTKHCAYPTYGFACPIVDAIEGVTHALRTTEYNDQNAQYAWLQEAMGLRRVNIETFGKVNFVHTVLSKRKLNWFVEKQMVDGWFDPRFPTIQGCIRRGMEIDAMRQFIYAQGASKRVITMEWDKFWSTNKQVLEQKAHRYMGVAVATAVPVIVSNFTTPGVTELCQTDLHPQKPEMGSRVMRRAENVLIERDDTSLFKEGDVITLLRWGNFTVEKMSKNADGDVIGVTVCHRPEDTDFRKTKKITWLADTSDKITALLTEFDHLINKPKLEEEDDFADFLTPTTKAETPAHVDACLRLVPEGTVVQLERRGFYRVDRAHSADAPAVLILVPDGRTKAMSTLSSALTHR